MAMIINGFLRTIICLISYQSVFLMQYELTKDGHDRLVKTSCVHDIYRDDQFCTPICIPINFCLYDDDPYDDDDHRHRSPHNLD